MEAHGVVQASLDVAGAPGCRTVKVGHADGDGLYAVFEVVAHRSPEQTELVFIGGFHPDHRAGGKQVGTQVQSAAAFKRRNVVFVGPDHFVHGFHKHFFRYRRHFQPFGGINHPFCILVRTEGNRTAVFGLVGFQPFEYFLTVLQDAGTFIENHVGVTGQAAFAPFAVFIVGNIPLGNGLISESQFGPIDVYIRHTNPSFLSYRTAIDYVTKMNFVYLNILLTCNGFVNEIVKIPLTCTRKLNHLVQ